MNNAIDVIGLTKSYKNFSLNDVRFSLPEGYIMGLIGPNGAGKTTIIKLILNLIKRQKGQITILGFDNIKNEEEIKQSIGVVFDNAYYANDWTITDVATAVKPFYKNWDGKSYLKWLSEFELSPKKRVQELSRGMKTKLMIAVALSHDARLLVLDEPSSGLDPVGRDELIEILGSYIQSGDRSVLFSTNVTADLEKIADYITFINKGNVVFTGTKDDLMESYCIIKGDRRDITIEQKKIVTGFREYTNGFEGLVPIKETKRFSSSIISEPANIDDIIVFMNRREKSE